MYKTYDIKRGYIGYDKDERILFPTEKEADEYFEEKKKEEKKKKEDD